MAVKRTKKTPPVGRRKKVRPPRPTRRRAKAGPVLGKEQNTQVVEGKVKRWTLAVCLGLTLFMVWPLLWPPDVTKVQVAKLVPKEDGFFQEFLSWMLKGEMEKMEPHFGEELRKVPKENLEKLIESLKGAGSLKTVYLAYFKGKRMPQGPDPKRLFYYVDFERGSGVITFSLRWAGDRFLVDGFWITPAVPLKDAGRFELSGRSWFHYSFLGLSFLLLLLWGRTLVTCAFSDIKHKWWWMFFLLISVCKLSLVWVPGAFEASHLNFNLISINMPSMGMIKTPIFDPWKIWMGFPIGMAAYYLVRWKKGKKV